jgi:cytochrome c oxidase subunit 3
MSTAATTVHHHAHHFDSAEAEFEACKQGMWIFMVTEVLMLGGLFVAYAIFRGLYLHDFAEAHHTLNWKLGATNTVILLTSSLTMVLGVSSAQRGRKDRTVLWLLLTILCACGFLVVKYIEYSTKFHAGVFPSGMMQDAQLLQEEHYHVIAHNPGAKIFMSLYFVMTGIHGLHVLIGMGLIGWITRRAAKGEFSPNYFTPVELVGFYWHFVDLVWIYLFPLLYLVS